MHARADLAWQFLGSTLWLRPLEEGDLPRLRAFLRRKDVLRAGNPATKLRSSEPERRLLSGPGLSLVALDPLGSPSGVFHLRAARGAVELSFAVPREEPEVLREAVRLLMVALPGRTRAERVAVNGLASEPGAVRAILAAGWSREGDILVLDLAARRGAEAPTHAG